jgi:hypothetical protein
MTDAPSIYAKARADVAVMLGYDLDNLTPEQATRLDIGTALRVLLDNQIGRLLRGKSLDARELLMASDALAKILPPLAAPPSEPREDPRSVMFRIYMEMRQRGELNLREIPDEEALQARISEQAREIERLKARLAGGLAPALLDVPTAIDPTEVVPPSEIGQCRAGPLAGPDDPPRRSPPVIEAVRKPPAANAAPQWDDTPNGKAWQTWVDAGGGGVGDPWANNNR